MILLNVPQDLLTQSAADSVAMADSLKKTSTPESIDEENERARAESVLALELSGFIVDETQTKIGRDFYEYFYSIWRAPEGSGDFNITISERPLPRRGTQITVVVNDFQVFQSFVQPRTELVEEKALYAAQRAYGFLRNYQAIMKQLQGDDMQGTGIF